MNLDTKLKYQSYLLDVLYLPLNLTSWWLFMCYVSYKKFMVFGDWMYDERNFQTDKLYEVVYNHHLSKVVFADWGWVFALIVLDLTVMKMIKKH